MLQLSIISFFFWKLKLSFFFWKLKLSKISMIFSLPFFINITKKPQNVYMNSIKYACCLNNQGVDLLVSGESKSAMTVFQRALSLLKKVNAETTSCTEMNLSCDDASLLFCESASKVSGFQGVNSYVYVYDHGIIIPDNTNGDSVETISFYIAILLFNSALAAHSEGTALGGEKSLMKASVLYSLVVQLLTRSTMVEDTSATILTLLALNNTAQIHYDQCEYVQSIDCMKTISKIMGSSVRGAHSALSDEDLEGLLLNVMVISTPPAAKAA
jgi:hypothetical protein